MCSLNKPIQISIKSVQVHHAVGYGPIFYCVEILMDRLSRVRWRICQTLLTIIISSRLLPYIPAYYCPTSLG